MSLVPLEAACRHLSRDGCVYTYCVATVHVHCNSHVMCARRFHCALVLVHAAFVTKCRGQLMFHLEAVAKARSEGPLKFPVPQRQHSDYCLFSHHFG